MHIYTYICIHFILYIIIITYVCVYVCIERKKDSAKSCTVLATPWTADCQASLSRGFSRQEYWSGLPFPSPGDLTDPGIELRSPQYSCLENPMDGGAW